MELFLGLAGLLGLSALLQSKALPAEKDYINALAVLNNKKDDPDASLIAGKYKAFVEGDYSAGLPYLSKGSDKILQGLALKEMDPENTSTAPKKVGMGDEWVAATKKYPQLARIFYDHASDWYASAFPQLDIVWKQKVREQGRKLGAARPPGPARKAFPGSWSINNPNDKLVPLVDGMIARTGSYSIKMGDKDPKATEMIFASAPISVAGKKVVEISGYALTDGTDNPTDILYANGFDASGTGVLTWAGVIPVDMPVWRKIYIKKDIPDNIVFIRVGAAKRSASGTIWVDDLSVKVDGMEILKNGSFEER